MTDPIRVLHFADLHIGMENYGRTDPNTGLSSRVVDFLRCMDQMIDDAIKNDVDLVIFAGDAFKSRNPTPTFQREFAFRVQDLASHCPVVLLVGNHDLPTIEKRASSIEIYETLSVPNTTVGNDYRIHQINTKRGPVVVGTAPYPIRSHLMRDVQLEHNSTIAQIDSQMEDRLTYKLQEMAEEASQYNMPRILTGHFTVTGATLGSERSVMLGRDIMVMLSTIADPVWDYVALGHIHKHQCLTTGRADAPPVVYSGSLERIDFGEEGDDKGYVLAEVQRGHTWWKFQSVNCRSFVTLRVDVKGSGNPTEKIQKEIARHDLNDSVVRLIITADPESDLLLQERSIQQALQDAKVSHVAAIQRDVERANRLRLGTSPEGLLPDQLLEHYLRSRKFSSEQIDELLQHARQIFEAEE
jgi:exonuclease SbcD